MLLTCAMNVHAARSDMPPSPDHSDEKVWTESDAPPPPAFNQDRLIPLEVGVKSSLEYGIDPQTLSISQTDGLVRYVLVARSSSGAVNVAYDAIRCDTQEIKTYARASRDGEWRLQSDPQWRFVQDGRSPIYAPVLVRSGLCDGKTVNGPVSTMIDALKRGGIPAKL